MVNDISNYGIFISKQIKKRCNNTHFIFFIEFIQNILKCIFIILIVLTIWLEYQNLEYLLCFHHQLAVAKGHTPYCIFLGPGQPYISTRATSKPNLSKSPLFTFLTSCNKVKDLLLPCIIFLAAASKCIVKNSQWTTCIKYRFSNKDYMNRFKTRFQTTLQFDVTVFPYFSSFDF